VLDRLVREVGEELARLGPLDLEVGELLGDRRDLDLQADDHVLEVVEVGVECGNDPAARVRELEDRAVADHVPVLVAEGRIAHLADLESQHVVREDAVGGDECIGAVEVPLPERRLVPDANALADGVVLGHRVAEVVWPVPAFPVHELDAHALLHLVEGRPDDACVAHSLSLVGSGPKPKAWDMAREVGCNSPTAAVMAPESKREAGPCTPTMAASSPPGPNTGAAIAFRSGSRSPSARAYPWPRTSASSASSRARSVTVRSVKRASRPAGSSASPKASPTFPAAVAWATLGLPSSATLTTDPGAWTKSMVTASGLDGAERVAVSPVRFASVSSSRRSARRMSSREWTRLPYTSSLLPSR